ncbi:TIGR03751 family conjugal transfer lipoprotein [Legionella septentrionalis]|uniref:TIGR03751 family conjugal transfer lipoprotein n=1 Tax=Legionella septentrionalis TaxID=2498109 RepID=A0A3S0X3U1_9GAMM|nr:TIGR03751 family conjugal transfer lipoprotein [Legionella septentrionalis]RUQ85132.1 TIGR03751 family conjugal transfer lipoprotein [Legionella septentrionalis]
MVSIKKNILIMLCASMGLSACSSTRITQTSIPEQGLTISQLYQQSKESLLPKSFPYRVSLGETNAEFKQLPNPEVPIHVFAHVAQLGDEQIIKPSYTTRFFLYKQNQYALASELY